MQLLAKAMHGGYVQNDAQRSQLQDGSSRVIDKQLQQALRGGVGFHHGNLEPQDRAIVEGLFLNRAIMVRKSEWTQHYLPLSPHAPLCETSGLAYRYSAQHQPWPKG